jgi:hypothetical protein
MSVALAQTREEKEVRNEIVDFGGSLPLKTVQSKSQGQSSALFLSQTRAIAVSSGRALGPAPFPQRLIQSQRMRWCLRPILLHHHRRSQEPASRLPKFLPHRRNPGRREFQNQHRSVERL